MFVIYDNANYLKLHVSINPIHYFTILFIKYKHKINQQKSVNGCFSLMSKLKYIVQKRTAIILNTCSNYYKSYQWTANWWIPRKSPFCTVWRCGCSRCIWNLCLRCPPQLHAPLIPDAAGGIGSSDWLRSSVSFFFFFDKLVVFKLT